jgi:nucleolar protein 4
MGKNKRERKDGEEKSPHAAATVCVSGLPYSITNAQLEEAFSEVGPVRRCFLVTNKGSDEHRGFAFVKFALQEDVNRAIELKNGSTVGGRRITVKQAAHRPSLQERRTKAAEGISVPDNSQGQSDKDTSIPETDEKVSPPEKKLEKPVERKKVEKPIERKQVEKPVERKKAEKPIELKQVEKPFERKQVEKPVERKQVEKPIERKRPTKLHVDLPDKETCSDKQRYDFYNNVLIFV